MVEILIQKVSFLKFSRHICQNGYYQNDNKEEVLVRTWGKGSLHALFVGLKWCRHYGKSVASPQKIKNRTAIWYSNSTSEYLSKENKNTNSKRYMETPLAVQWLRLCLPMKGMQVQSLVGEIRPYMPPGWKTKNIKQKQYCNKFDQRL